MPAIAFLVPESLHRLTGGSIYDRRIAEGLRARGWSVDVRELASPSEAAGVLPSLRPGTTALVDGLIFGVVPEIVERQAARIRFAALVHLPLAEEPGLPSQRVSELADSERRSLAHAACVIATGHSVLPTLAAYGVSRDRIEVIEPGTDAAPLAPGTGVGPTRLLSVAALTAGKGHSMLIGALAASRSRAWHLTLVGDLRRDPGTVSRVMEAIAAAGLSGRVALTGELRGEALVTCYLGADAFVLATVHETYGMAVAEALAHGLPVVSTATGAIPALVGDAAGLLVPPGDGQALAAALARFLDDEVLRQRLREGARRVRPTLRRWDAAVGEMAAALCRLTDV